MRRSRPTHGRPGSSLNLGCEALESRRLLAAVPVTGFVFNDPNVSGVYNGANLPNRVVWADLNTDGVRDAGEPFASTGTDGQLYTLNLEPGRYLLRQELPPRWVETGRHHSADVGDFESSGWVTVPEDLGLRNSARLSFGARLFPSIQGVVFDDVNYNGFRDTGEGYVGTASAYLDLDNDQVADPNEPRAFNETSAGYTFAGLAPGTYTVRLLLGANSTYVRTFPGSGSHVVTVADGQTVTGVNFGASNRGRVIGWLYHDKDGDGARDAVDTPLANRTVAIGGISGVTDQDGKYVLDGVPAGSQSVAPANFDGWKTPAPLTRTVAVAAAQTVNAPDVFSAKIVPSPHRDTAFHGGTYVYTWARAADAVTLPDGKQLVIAGGGTGGLTALRFNPDGSDDTTFGSSGQKSLGSLGLSFPERIALQPDGKIIWVEQYDPDGEQIARLNPDLTLDTTFGVGGRMRLDLLGGTWGYKIEEIAFGQNGAIVLAGAGHSSTFGNGQMAVVRLTSTGAYDNTFDGDGRLLLAPGTSTESNVSGLAVQADGGIVIAGARRENNVYRATLMRLTSAGAVDTSFATGGMDTQPTWGWTDLLLQPDGKMLVGGPLGGFSVARYTAAGTLDSAFGGGDGVATAPFTRNGGGNITQATVNRLTLAPDGGIVAVGHVDATANSMSDFAVARFLPSGAPDTGFGSGGVVAEGFGHNHDQAKLAAVDAQGGVVVIGNRHIDPGGSQQWMYRVRYRPPVATPVNPVTLRATADAHVRDGSSAAANFGSATELQLKRSSSAGSTREMYLKFDLSGVASVQNAKLRLWGRIDSATQAPQVAVYPVSNTTWAENTINWNNRPAAGTAALATTTVSTATSKWYEFDVTSYLAAEKAAGRNVVTLLVRSLSNTDPYLIFSSDEATANKPELVVTPSGGTPPPPPPQALVVSTTSLSVPEASKASFTVALAAQPTTNVTVTVAKGGGVVGDPDLSVSTGSTLTFTPANWNVPQPVWISALDDADTTNGSAVFQVESPGLTMKLVTATEAENDTSSGQTTTNLRAAADAYVRDGSYATQNFGTATQMYVKRSGTVGNTRESYLRFNIADLPAGDVFSATLRLFAKSNSSTQGVTLQVLGCQNINWPEGGVTWNTRPVPGTDVLASRVVSDTTGTYYEFDLSDFVRGQRAAGVQAVTFAVRAGTTTDAQAVIESDETANAAQRPELRVVTYTSGPPPQSIVVSGSQVSVPEGGNASFTVRLAAAPTSDVVVNVARTGGDNDVSAGTSSLTFTPANWNTPQTVQLAAAQDADINHNSAIFTLSSTGLSNRTVTATEIDDDDLPSPVTTLRASADAYVRDGTAAGTNFGSATELQLKKSGAGSNREIYLKFDVTTLSTISSAKLRIWGRIDSSTEQPSVAVYGASDTSWTETGLTWNNRPAAGATALATTTVATSTARWYEWDVTSYLAAQKAAGATSVTLVLRSLTTTTPHMIFNSDEATTNRPELLVS